MLILALRVARHSGAVVPTLHCIEHLTVKLADQWPVKYGLAGVIAKDEYRSCLSDRLMKGVKVKARSACIEHFVDRGFHIVDTRRSEIDDISRDTQFDSSPERLVRIFNQIDQTWQE